MKEIRRKYYDSPCVDELKDGSFVCVGQWANGNLAYSRLNEDGEIIDDEDGMYYQIRECGKLVMIHC